MSKVAKLGRAAGAVALAFGIAANVHAATPAFEWTATIQDSLKVLTDTFTIDTLIDQKVSLVDNNFTSRFDSLNLLIAKTGGTTMVTLSGPGEQTFSPTAIGSYTAVLVGDPGTSSISTFGLTVAAVPEAETWAMMLVGMGLVGWQLRRKVKASAATRFV